MYDKNKAWEYRLKKVYGLTKEQYQFILDKQDGKCFICERPAESFSKRLAIDHDHRTFEVIGCLCTYCNTRVIGRERRPNIYKRAALYLEQGTGWFVPIKKKVKKKK